MTTLLSVSGLAVQYRGTTQPILSGIGWAQGPGEVVYLVGRNGSGKSSLFRALAGDVGVRCRGRVTFLDAPAPRRPLDWRRLGVRWIPQQGPSFRELSVREDLEFSAAVEGAPSIRAALNLFPSLGALLPRQVRLLSGGERRMIDLASLVFVEHPSIFWLDEPFAGLSGENIAAFSAFLSARVQSGTALLISTHLRSRDAPDGIDLRLTESFQA